MTFLRKILDYWYVCRVPFGSGRGGGCYSKSKVVRDWFLVKAEEKYHCSKINLGVVSIPNEFVGKRIRFVVEVLPKDNNGLEHKYNKTNGEIQYEK